VVDGCEAFFHTASPSDLIEPVVKSTLTVLKSCVKVLSIKRVVLIVFMGSILWNGKCRSPGEAWFSDPQFCEKKQFWYMLLKTLAEHASWKFLVENGSDLVAINPWFVICPYLQHVINLMVEEVVKLVKGTHQIQIIRY
ncbi:Phenylacetaldehyde reductase, partial [Linum grandiflorum]